MSHSAKKSRHRSPCTARSMTRLALGPLILTGLFLVGSVCADPVRAEEIDLASQPGFNTMRRDWIDDGSTIRLKRIWPAARRISSSSNGRTGKGSSASM